MASLAQAVEECVHNSLDAGASSVEVALEVSSLHATIHDDGVGVLRGDMDHLGVRHYTSKAEGRENTCLGSRGESLSAIAGTTPPRDSLGARLGPHAHCLGPRSCRHRAGGGTIQTQRPAVHPPQGVPGEPTPTLPVTLYAQEHWAERRTSQAERTLVCGLAAIPRRQSGTTVHIRDFMFNQPVRRRAAGHSPRKVERAVYSRLLSLLLVNPHVAFKFRVVQADEGAERTILHAPVVRAR